MLTYPSPKPTLAKGVTVVEIVQQSVKTRRIRYYVENESTRCEFTEQQKILSQSANTLLFIVRIFITETELKTH